MANSIEASSFAFDSQKASISRITFETNKKFSFVELCIVNEDKTQLLKVASQSTSKIEFHLPKGLVLEPQVSLHLVYQHTSFFAKRHKEDIGFQEILHACAPGENDSTIWKKSYGSDLSCLLIVELGKIQQEQQNGHGPSRGRSPSLRPTTDRILEACPHFRILVIGKTGAGKSSLINKAFGVEGAIVSHRNPGKANIETEIRSKSNPQFVLHDSLGFEHGEGNNLSVVQEFILRLDGEPELRKKLHAIWICLEIPIMGGRLLESGVESFLELKRSGKLGDVPVIVVFTKYDKLVEDIKQELFKKDPKSTTLDKDAKERAGLELKTLTEPMNKTMVAHVPHITVSTSEGLDYQQTLQELIEVTFETVYNYLADASVVAAIAQKVNPDVKIRAIIEVGKRKYWSGLGASLNFPSYTLERCLGVIHTDIVRVWGFQDESGWLLSPDFKALMANGVDFKAEGKSNATLSVGLSMVAALAGIVSVLSGPAAPIVIPIAGAFVFAAWVREVYSQTQVILRRLMTYIIDLTLVTQNLFWIQNTLGLTQTSVTRRMIKLAFILHIHSEERARLVNRIEEYSKNAKAVIGPGADRTFEEIEILIKSSLIKYEHMFMEDQQDYLKKQLKDLPEEGWSVGEGKGKA